MKVKKNPLVSFCLATYKRPQSLGSTLAKILKQTYDNFEILVSDNDPEGSAEAVVKKFRSSKIHYYKNKTNIGMVANFNAALSHASGEFVTFITDDDPPVATMLETLVELSYTQQNCVQYLGASFIELTSPAIAKLQLKSPGLLSMKHRYKDPGAVTTYSSKDFFIEFINHNVLPHYLWSTGIARRNTILEIGGIPEYESPHFTDYAYMLLLSGLGKTAVINTELGINSYHDAHYGNSLKGLDEYATGAIRFHKLFEDRAAKFGISKQFDSFIADHVLTYFIDCYRFYKRIKNVDITKKTIASFSKILASIPAFSVYKSELQLRLQYPETINYFFLIKNRITREFRSWSLNH